MPNRSSINTLTFLVAIVVASHVSAQQWGDVKLTFQYNGKPPAPVPVVPAGGCGQGLVKRALIVNANKLGIKNVVLYAYEGRGGAKLPAVHPDHAGKQTLTLANKNCQFSPRIVCLQSGDVLQVTNPDPVGHNANLQFLVGKSYNPLLPPNGKVNIPVVAQPAPIPVTCNIHPWMEARVVVLENRYAAVSDAEGQLILKNLPAGVPLALRLYHEQLQFKGAKVGSVGTVNRRSVIELEKIEPGMNDLGIVLIK